MAAPSPPSPRRTIAQLATCYALSLTSLSLILTASPLVGAALAPVAGLATLPVSLQVLGTMAASVPASLLMGRIGRRNGFLVGLIIGTAGAVTATLGILWGSFLLFCLGGFGMGLLNGFSQFYRFAAADAAEPAYRSRAISYVMAGGVLAGLVGPALAAGTADVVADARFVGSYATIILLSLVASAIMLFVRIPPRPPRPDAVAARPLRVIIREPRFLTAVFASMVAYGTMSLLMTATPLSMQQHGHSLTSSAMVIQAHVVAMFAPSFVTGHLIHRFGRGRVMTTGLVSLGGALLVAGFGISFGHFVAALVLLGFGWNFLFVGGTDLLTTLHSPEETPKVQGVNDLFVFGTAAGASFLAGYLQQAIGWHDLVVTMGPILLVATILLGVFGWWGRDRPEVPASVPPVP